MSEWLLIGALACWRATHLLHGEDGPGDVLIRLRRLAGTGVFGQLLDCFYCLSLWIAIPLAALVAGGWRDGVLLWLGMSGGAILLERVTVRVSYVHESEVDDELLRKGTASADRHSG